MPLSVFTHTMPGCCGVCAAAVVAADLGFAVLPVAAALLDWVGAAAAGAEAVLADAAGCPGAALLAVFDFRDLLLVVDSVVLLAVVVDEVLSAAFDFFDFFADF